MLSRALQQMLLGIANQPPSNIPTYLEAVEAHLKRSSSDLKLYDYQLVLEHVATLTREVCSSLQIYRYHLDQPLEPTYECALGHLSLGRDRAGNDFSPSTVEPIEVDSHSSSDGQAVRSVTLRGCERPKKNGL